LKITILNPHFHKSHFRNNKTTRYDIHGYYIEFIRKYKPSIYLSKKFYYSELCELFDDTGLNIDEFDINYPTMFQRSIFSNTDVLLDMNGGGIVSTHPDYIQLYKKFNGLKIFHIMDPQYFAKELNAFLLKSGIDYLLGYNTYDKHSNFVRQIYPSFINKFIGIPFGYAPVWEKQIPFKRRKNMALLSGTMETFSRVKSSKYYKQVIDYYNFFHSSFNSMHEIRYLIDKNIEMYKKEIDSKINHWPEQNNYIEDIVGEFNKFRFFINDESLLNFCPIRTYEGIAAGCVLIAHEATCYKEWGFIDGKNCIMFNNINEIPDKIHYYIDNEELLKKINNNGYDLVTNNYNHKSIADKLYKAICELFY